MNIILSKGYFVFCIYYSTRIMQRTPLYTHYPNINITYTFRERQFIYLKYICNEKHMYTLYSIPEHIISLSHHNVYNITGITHQRI